VSASVPAPEGRVVTCGVTASPRTEIHLGRLMSNGAGRPFALRDAVAAHRHRESSASSGRAALEP
jgi:hypothetical protein